MPKLILGLTGQIGSGKGCICTYLEKAYGAEVFKFSTYLSRVLDMLALENSRDNLIRLSETLRQTFGENALEQAIARDAAQTSAPIAVVDGIRRPSDFVQKLESLPEFRLMAVEADEPVRYERIANRGEKTDEAALTWEQFLENQQRSTERTVPETMKRATLRIQNNGTPEELEKELDALMKTFGIKKRG